MADVLESLITVEITPNININTTISSGLQIEATLTPNVEIISNIASGARGKSAYEFAVSQGFVGTAQEWLDSLVGPPGEPGGSVTKWIDYVIGYFVAPFQLDENMTYMVFQYEYENNLILYRKISKIDLNDEFYSTYQNGILSNLLVSKKL